ncbi:MAG: hypothetical protein K2N06_10735 [Oscillospiraceae bacterium]|nr:hypothetical protein [Oscillospiraceae bacterium]
MSEKKYSKVQMIGLAISTTPGNMTSIAETSDDGSYLGFDDLQKDISMRIDFLKEAIKQAYEMRDKSSDVLKVFTIPEFFFRGNKGAYLGDNREIFNTHFDDLVYGFLAKKDFADWLFVLGTLLTSNTKADNNKEPAKSLAKVGDSLVSIYNWLHPTNSETMQNDSLRKNPSLSSLLKILDKKENVDSETACASEYLNSSEPSKDKDYLDFLSNTLNYCDSIADIDVYNCCYIVEGGTSKSQFFSVQKKYKSKEDFILRGPNDNYLQTTVRYPDIPEGSEIKKDPSDPYSIFNFHGINFGIEICLDHRCKRLVNAHEQQRGQLVDVQIVVSCGMAIRDESIAAVENGIVFNCDGEYALNKEDEKNGKHYHTMLKIVNRSAQIQPAVKKEEITYNVSLLYPGETYEIHVYPPLDLPNNR